MALRDIIDDGREGATLIMSVRSRAARVVVTALVGGLLAFHFGAKPALLWGAVNLVLEAWLVHLKMNYRGQRSSRSNRFLRLAPPAAFSIAWSVMAALSAIHGPPAMKFAALVILFGLIVEGLKYATLSWSAMLSLMPWPFLALAAAPIFAPRFNVWDKAVGLIVLAGLLGYTLDAVRLMRGSAKALEQAQAEALEASRAKSAFVAMMSHELRTPMNGVLGLAHALRDAELNDRQAGYVDMIIQSGDGLMAILNDILDLSKVEAGKLELETVAFDVRRLAEQVRLVWNEAAKLKDLALTLEVEPSVPEWLEGDPLRVRQIVQNLVSNAVKFTETGSVAIRVASDGDGDGAGIVVSVADTGVGLAPDQAATLFSPFVQADRSIARRFGGTGLGLAISRQLAELMGGGIAVESRLGEGSTFSVRLALSEAAAPQSAVVAASHWDEAGEDLAGARVLVVDDNRVNQAVARAILESVGVLVTTADGGREALDRLAVERFDLVLMDVHMPGMDGVEAVRRIRAGEAGPADTPVIALTADAMVGEADRLVAQGFDDAQPKPVEPARLLRAVARLRVPAVVEVRRAS